MAFVQGLDPEDETGQPIGGLWDPNKYRNREERQPSMDSAMLMGLIQGKGSRRRGGGNGKIGQAIKKSYSPGFDHEVLYGPNVEGHEGHLHLASDKGLKRLGRVLEKKGFDVGEHPRFGNVTGVHTGGSHHYSGNALDINYNGGGRWDSEADALRWLKKRLKRVYGNDAYYGG